MGVLVHLDGCGGSCVSVLLLPVRDGVKLHPDIQYCQKIASELEKKAADTWIPWPYLPGTLPDPLLAGSSATVCCSARVTRLHTGGEAWIFRFLESFQLAPTKSHKADRRIRELYSRSRP